MAHVDSTSASGSPFIRLASEAYGPSARDRRTESLVATPQGARAALETFYFAFHQRSIEALESVWGSGDLVTLDNPVGGVIRGARNVIALYRGIFSSPARVEVELRDIVELIGADTVIFAGREHGTFELDAATGPLLIRTTRVFHYLGGLGWRMVHHHGSIDDPAMLERYQRALRA